jgi:hypothetical protein
MFPLRNQVTHSQDQGEAIMTDEELIEELSEMGRHPCRAHLPMGERLRQASDRIEALTAEVAAYGRSLELKQALIEELKADNDMLRKVVEASEGLKRDLLHRAKWDDDAKVVCAGTSAWLRFTEALEALEKKP